MSFFNISNPNKNPASIMIDTMQAPARPWNFDVEFFVAGLDKIGGEDAHTFQYYVTEVDKPKFDFQYEEINQYGFRYPLLTGIRFTELNMTLIDDAANKTLAFFQYYLSKSVNTVNGEASGTRFIGEGAGVPLMEVDPQYANIRALGGDEGNGVIIQKIKLHQYSSVGSDGSPKGRVRTWTFTDPQIINMDMENFSTDNDDIGRMNIAFNYKNVFMELNGSEFANNPFAALFESELGIAAQAILQQSDNRYLRAIGFDAEKTLTDPFGTGALGGQGALTGTAAGSALRGAGQSIGAGAGVLGLTNSGVNSSRDGFVDTSKDISISPTNVARNAPSGASAVSKAGKIFG